MLRRTYQLQRLIHRFLKISPDDVSSLHLSPAKWQHVEYFIQLLHEFSLYTKSLSKHEGPSIHRVYNVYKALFNPLKDLMEILGKKQQLWKNQVYTGLQAARKKLQQFYQRTYGFTSIIYWIATLLNPTRKLNAFRSESWQDRDMNWAYTYQKKLISIAHMDLKK